MLHGPRPGIRVPRGIRVRDPRAAPCPLCRRSHPEPAPHASVRRPRRQLRRRRRRRRRLRPSADPKLCNKSTRATRRWPRRVRVLLPPRAPGAHGCGRRMAAAPRRGGERRRGRVSPGCPRESPGWSRPCRRPSTTPQAAPCPTGSARVSESTSARESEPAAMRRGSEPRQRSHEARFAVWVRCPPVSSCASRRSWRWLSRPLVHIWRLVSGTATEKIKAIGAYLCRAWRKRSCSSLFQYRRCGFESSLDLFCDFSTSKS